MSNRFFFNLLLSSFCFLSACSGGGGGGGESAGTTGVRVLHGAIEATPVDLIIDAAPTSAQMVRYGESGGYFELGEGQHLLQLSESKGTPGSLFSQSITNDGGQKFTLLFYGDRENFGLHTTLIKESAPEIASGSGSVRVIDGMVGAASVTLTIASTSTTAVFGNASLYLGLPPAIYPYTVKRTSDGAIVAQGSISIEDGRASSIFVGGELGYFVTSRILIE